MLGSDQLEWLIDALVDSQAIFKFIVIGNQVLNPAAVEANYANYEDERLALLEAIEEEGVRGVFFLTGDRHRTELTKLERPGAYPLYDLTVSPLTAGVSFAGATEANTLRVDDTLVAERNFALLDFDGPAEDRRLTITVIDKDGNERWTREIYASELR